MAFILIVILGVNSGAHPGMNAALELCRFTFRDVWTGCTRICGQKDVVCAGRLRHQVSAYHLGALRGWRWISRCRVKSGNETTTKFLYPCERMCLTAQVLQRKIESFFCAGLVWSKTPRSY